MIKKFEQLNESSGTHNPFVHREPRMTNTALGIGHAVVFQDEYDFDPHLKGLPLQRGFVWSLKMKQDLIESIYKNKFIGSVVVVDKVGKISVIDGKQRLSTILDFVNNKFPDLSGHFYKDLTIVSQRIFKGRRCWSYIELPSDSTPKEIRDAFLYVNTKGIKQDDKHIEYVESMDLD